MEGRGSPEAARSAAVRAKGSVEPIMLMRSPGAPWEGWRGFHPVKVPSGTRSSTGMMPAISLPSPSTAQTKVLKGAPALGGSSVTTPSAKETPKSSRAGRAIRSGKRRPGMAAKVARVDSPATAVPSARRGKALGGGSTLADTHRSRLTRAARRSGA